MEDPPVENADSNAGDSGNNPDLVIPNDNPDPDANNGNTNNQNGSNLVTPTNQN